MPANNSVEHLAVRLHPSPIKHRPSPVSEAINTDATHVLCEPLPSPVIDTPSHPSPTLKKNKASTLSSLGSSVNSDSYEEQDDRLETVQTQKSDWEISKEYWTRMRRAQNTGSVPNVNQLLRWKHEIYKREIQKTQEQYVSEEVDRLLR